MPATLAPACPDAPTLARALAALGAGCDIETVAETGSTNSDLLERARTQQFPRPLLRAAGHQTAGRGRLGRRWLAAPGDALLFSLAVPVNLPPAQIASATPACGVALAETCRAAGVAASIKWPNDLWLDGAKLAGVLSELAIDPQGRRCLIVGVGINWRLDAATRAAIEVPAAALADAGGAAALSREDWIARLAHALLTALDQFAAQGLAPFAARWASLDVMHDRAVLIRQGETVLAQGIARGIDTDGALLLDTDSGRQRIVSGEASLRAAP